MHPACHSLCIRLPNVTESSCMQDELAKLNKEVEDRHAKELQELEARDAAAASSGAAAAAVAAAAVQPAEALAQDMAAASLDHKASRSACACAWLLCACMGFVVRVCLWATLPNSAGQRESLSFSELKQRSFRAASGSGRNPPPPCSAHRGGAACCVSAEAEQGAEAAREACERRGGARGAHRGGEGGAGPQRGRAGGGGAVRAAGAAGPGHP